MFVLVRFVFICRVCVCIFVCVFVCACERSLSCASTNGGVLLYLKVYMCIRVLVCVVCVCDFVVDRALVFVIVQVSVLELVLVFLLTRPA